MRSIAVPLVALGLAGCLGGAPAAEEEPVPAAARPPAEPGEALPFTNVTGTLVALPLVGGEAAFTYEVPEGSTWVAATLKWRTRGSALTLTVIDPEGKEGGESRTLAASRPGASTRLDWWSPEPLPGAWRFLVRGQAALQEPLWLQFHTLQGPVEGMHVAEALALGRFAEVNMNMEQGATVAYAWEASRPIHFDVHTHRNGETQYWVDETAQRGEGSVTADQRDVFSLLWAPEGERPALPGEQEPIELWYRVDGAFDLHSAVG